MDRWAIIESPWAIQYLTQVAFPFQNVHLNMDFRSVRYFIWKSASEIKFLYAFKDDKIGQKIEESDIQ